GFPLLLLRLENGAARKNLRRLKARCIKRIFRAEDVCALEDEITHFADPVPPEPPELAVHTLPPQSFENLLDDKLVVQARLVRGPAVELERDGKHGLGRPRGARQIRFGAARQ